LLAEPGTSGTREVDVLIEAHVASESVRIAVECRDHARPADLTWIDQLEGKYRNLGIDKVIAVARSGFSADAALKASALGIETKTLREGLETDWPEQLARINFRAYGFKVNGPMQVVTIARPPWRYPQPERVTVDEEEVDPRDFVHMVIDQILEEFNRSRNGQRVMPGESFEATFELPCRDVRFLSSDVAHEVEKLIVTASLIGFEERLPASRSTLGHVGVTTVKGVGNLSRASFVVTQESGKDEAIARVYWNEND